MSLYTKVKFHTKNTGFTLIELMVALMLFTIVTLAAVSSLYTVNNAAKKVEAMRAVLDNLNFAVDSMSRTIRTGSNITCFAGTPTPGAPSHPFSGSLSPCDHIAVKATLGAATGVTYDVQYALDDSLYNDNCATQCVLKKKIDNGPWVSLTAPEINVTKLDFYTDGTDNDKQPSVVMFIQGVAKTQNDIAPFAIQTYVSQRSTEAQ